jgi:hypothetical protein
MVTFDICRFDSGYAGLELFEYENRATTVFRNIGNYLSVDMSQYSRRLESSVVAIFGSTKRMNTGGRI